MPRWSTLTAPFRVIFQSWHADRTGSLAFHSVEDHPPLLAVISEGVFPLAAFGQNAEPFLRHLGRGQLAVVLEDDGGRVACLQRHLIGALDDGDPVTDE